MVRVMQKCDFAATVAALTSMFEELGGTPKRVMSDNPKVFVNLASKHEPLLNAGYERFSSYYGFTIEALPPSDPQKKGKVERTVQLVRRLFVHHRTSPSGFVQVVEFLRGVGIFSGQ